MVSNNVEFHPSALVEAEAARDWYAERSLIASRAFVAELNHAIEQVVQDPEIWPFYEGGTRRYIFPRFPFCVIYRIVEEKILIIAIAHSRRKPEYWKNR